MKPLGAETRIWIGVGNAAGAVRPPAEHDPPSTRRAIAQLRIAAAANSDSVLVDHDRDAEVVAVVWLDGVPEAHEEPRPSFHVASDDTFTNLTFRSNPSVAARRGRVGNRHPDNTDVVRWTFGFWLKTLHETNFTPKSDPRPGTPPTPTSPRRVDRIAAEGARRIAASFESVQDYVEHALADLTRPIDPEHEEMVQGHLQALAGWSHTDRDPVVYERLMAGLARLLPGLFETDVARGEITDEDEHLRSATVEVLDAVAGIGSESEDVDRDHLEQEVLPALEEAARATSDLAEAVTGPEPEFAPGAGRQVDGFLDNTEPWVGRLQRAGEQINTSWKSLPVSMRIGSYVAGAGATLQWVITAIRHIWGG